jgi:hypothetical protein
MAAPRAAAFAARGNERSSRLRSRRCSQQLVPVQAGHSRGRDGVCGDFALQPAAQQSLTAQPAARRAAQAAQLDRAESEKERDLPPCVHARLWSVQKIEGVPFGAPARVSSVKSQPRSALPSRHVVVVLETPKTSKIRKYVLRCWSNFALGFLSRIAAQGSLCSARRARLTLAVKSRSSHYVQAKK